MIPAETYVRVHDALSPDAVPAGVDINSLPKDEQRALVKAEMLRKQRARGVSRGH